MSEAEGHVVVSEKDLAMLKGLFSMSDTLVTV
jgi:hypothetical protein